MENLPEWTQTKNIDYKDLEEIYTEAIYVYRRYMYHVLNIVGGVYETRNSRKKIILIPTKMFLKRNRKRLFYFFIKTYGKVNFG